MLTDAPLASRKVNGVRVETVEKGDNSLKHTWLPSETVQAVAFDTPIAGWRGKRVNTLRLWSAQALDPLGCRLAPPGPARGC